MDRSTEQYTIHHTECLRLLASLAEELAHHAASQAKEPQNWGFVGDITALEAALSDAVLWIRDAE